MGLMNQQHAVADRCRRQGEGQVGAKGVREVITGRRFNLLNFGYVVGYVTKKRRR